MDSIRIAERERVICKAIETVICKAIGCRPTESLIY